MNKTLIVVPVYNNAAIIQNIIEIVSGVDDTDIIFIDDGSTDETYEIIREHKGIKYIKHDAGPGYGALLISGLRYAQDHDYDTVLILDPESRNMMDDIHAMMENIRYGYDIVSCSRILENFDYQKLPDETLLVTGEIHQKIKEITGFDVTDPLSGIRAIRLESIRDMELTDFTHGVLLQLLIQAAYFGLEVIEIPSNSGSDPGKELLLYEDSLDMFLEIMEAEQYLYKKGTIN